MKIVRKKRNWNFRIKINFLIKKTYNPVGKIAKKQCEGVLFC